MDKHEEVKKNIKTIKSGEGKQKKKNLDSFFKNVFEGSSHSGAVVNESD